MKQNIQKGQIWDIKGSDVAFLIMAVNSDSCVIGCYVVDEAKKNCAIINESDDILVNLIDISEHGYKYVNCFLETISTSYLWSYIKTINSDMIEKI